MSTVFNTGLPKAATLTLQCCAACKRVNYPTRELCGHCLADALQWQPVSATGVVQSLVRLHYSLEPAYLQHLPWTVASVKLDCGPVVLAHMPPGSDSNTAVTVKIIQDNAGNCMLLATAADRASQQAESAWLGKVNFREISA